MTMDSFHDLGITSDCTAGIPSFTKPSAEEPTFIQ
jgi:hypothetical protein